MEPKSAKELRTHTQEIEEMKVVKEKERKDQLSSNFKECREAIKKAQNQAAVDDADDEEFCVCFEKELSQAHIKILRKEGYGVSYYNNNIYITYDGP